MLQEMFKFVKVRILNLTANYGDSYLWSTGETTQSIMVSEAGNYSVTVQNSNCSFVYTDLQKLMYLKLQ